MAELVERVTIREGGRSLTGDGFSGGKDGIACTEGGPSSAGSTGFREPSIFMEERFVGEAGFAFSKCFGEVVENATVRDRGRVLTGDRPAGGPEGCGCSEGGGSHTRSTGLTESSMFKGGRFAGERGVAGSDNGFLAELVKIALVLVTFVDRSSL
jgi:hypothetical protein